ncbi:dihydrolipoyl dehydrogenase [Geminicoccus roseus]|uniref:dihydrolipoyl dehydrogenase n=1 Tax=Geminicoccus roseus TaxID=404900 RepID=UPI00041163EF|nr:dihydrolipoyl dehydrogenase [Geminicoccus roseus]
MSEPYDVVVVGGGPGGYVGAIKAAQLGMKVACVEKRGRLGGTCLNVGCIPSKALLHTSHLYEEAQTHFEKIGIRAKGGVELDLGAMLDNKDDVVEALTKGIEGLFKKYKVDYIKGAATLTGSNAMDVALLDGGSQQVGAKNIILATGSDVMPLPGVELVEGRVVDSTGALDLDEVPKHLIVIGGGYIGLELGTVWRRLGAKVTVVEYLDRITPGMDGEVSKTFQRILAKQGVAFKLGTKVTGVDSSGELLKVHVEPAKGGEPEVIEGDVVLVSIGRRPYTEGLGLEAAGVALDERQRISTHDDFSTNVPGIYAIGDAIKGPMLAHKAEEEGVAVAEILAGQKPHIDYNLIPGVVYTDPEVAALGQTEEQLKAAGVEYKTGKFSMMANSRARAVGRTDGFVKLLTEAGTDKILGCHIIAADAGTMINEVTVAMEFGASAEDLARTSHPHPTLEEAIKEAALASFAKPIHM